jgi:hypothetical protein
MVALHAKQYQQNAPQALDTKGCVCYTRDLERKKCNIGLLGFISQEILELE